MPAAAEASHPQALFVLSLPPSLVSPLVCSSFDRKAAWLH